MSSEEELATQRSDWLREELAYQGFEARDVARRSRFATGEISLWLSGEKPLTAAALHELAQSLDLVPPPDLLEQFFRAPKR